MTVACYMRVSSDEQRKRHTIGTQREQLERYANNVALPVAEWYSDDGVSGTIPLDQRPAGTKLIADARAGRIARLLVYKLDRLGRDALVTLSAIDALDQCGVEIVSITQALDLKTPHGRFMAVIDCGVSGYERDTLVERSIDGSARIDRHDFAAAGVVLLLYGDSFTTAQRALIEFTHSNGLTCSCCDLSCATDVAFALYLRDELDSLRGIAPMTLASQEYARAGTVSTSGD